MSKEGMNRKLSALNSKLNETRIELTSNQEALIEGCKCVLEYDDTMIRLAAKCYEIRFTGVDLSLCCLSTENVVVSGKILSVEFI